MTRNWSAYLQKTLQAKGQFLYSNYFLKALSQHPHRKDEECEELVNRQKTQ